MKTEIIAVGSELLLGQITNTNARFISEHLNEMGLHVYYHTVVGDNRERLKRAITVAQSRSDLIIFSGGLGPTKDDLTKETIAEHLDVPLEIDKRAMASIEYFFTSRNREMTPNNAKQALVLKGAHVFENKQGLAPGFHYTDGEKHYILLPGPPSEIEPMFQYEVKPYLHALITDGHPIYSKVLRFFGIGEAALEEKVSAFLDMKNPTVAPLASDGEVTLRVTASSKTTEEAKRLVDPVVEDLKNVVGEYLYGYDDDSLAKALIRQLVNHHLTLSAAESLTAGLFMSELAAIPGVSGTLQGGAVVYNEEMKMKQLNISKQLIDTYTVVSSECAAAMAQNVRRLYGSDVGVGLTGAAGPDPHDGSAVGTVWIGIAIGEEVSTYLLKLPYGRNTNRLLAVKNALFRTKQLLTKKGYH